MKPKNIKQQRLESNRFTFTQIGLVVSLALVLLAFEWKTPLHRLIIPQDNSNQPVIDDYAPVNTGVKPPPPPPAPPTPISIINAVDNNTKVADISSFNVEAKPDDIMPGPPVPPQATQEIIPEPDPPFKIVERMPEFPGGEIARLEYLRDNIRYPQVAREANIQGTVFVEFIIEKDGSISHITLMRGIGGGCDEEAMRVIGQMPKWIPGYQLNKPVRVQFTMPVKFLLR